MPHTVEHIHHIGVIGECNHLTREIKHVHRVDEHTPLSRDMMHELYRELVELAGYPEGHYGPTSFACGTWERWFRPGRKERVRRVRPSTDTKLTIVRNCDTGDLFSIHLTGYYEWYECDVLFSAINDDPLEADESDE